MQLTDMIWVPLTQHQLDTLNTGEIVKIEIPHEAVINLDQQGDDPPNTTVVIRPPGVST